MDPLKNLPIDADIFSGHTYFKAYKKSKMSLTLHGGQKTVGVLQLPLFKNLKLSRLGER